MPPKPNKSQRKIAGTIASITGLVLALAAAGILVKLGGTDSVAVHLFYLPIIYAAFVFGDYGAILVALAAAMICGVWMPAGYELDGTPQAQVLHEILVRAAVFYVVGIVCSRAAMELKRRIAEQRTLYEVAASITSTLRIRSVLDLIAHAALQVMDAKGCAIRLLNEESGELELVSTAGLSSGYWEKGPVTIGSSPVNQTILRGEWEEIYNAPTDPRIQYQQEAREAGLTSVLTVPLASKDHVTGLVRIYARRRHHFHRREVDLLEAFAHQASVAIENAQLYEDIRRNYFETVRALTRAIEAKDLATFSHSERVAEVVDQIATQAGMNADQREILRFGSILHDVGKIGIGEQSLEARETRDTEQVFYRMHPLIGQSILQPVGFLEPIVPVVLYHHERWDGRGFPEGLKGKDIPEMARMVAIADHFDRLRYVNGDSVPGMSVREAVEQITAEASSRFDPELVRLLRRVILVGANAELPATADTAPPEPAAAALPPPPEAPGA
ncbi:MAG TPA: HD domain-containing phosphohydrolase [Armatimonadota bacterium]|jgi:HD-GYP domain-containing protein (c-di-GMP phosphodiesterase class II)